jgi:signal peptidase I
MSQLSGSLSFVEVGPLVRLLANLRKTGELVLSQDCWSARLLLDHGRLTGAAVADRGGVEALEFICVALSKAEFDFQDRSPNVSANLEPNPDPLAQLERLAGETHPWNGTLPAPQAVPHLVRSTTLQNDVDVVLGLAALHVLGDMDGRVTVLELAARHGLLRTLKSLNRLRELGVIAYDSTEAPPPAGPQRTPPPPESTGRPQQPPEPPSRQPLQRARIPTVAREGTPARIFGVGLKRDDSAPPAASPSAANAPPTNPATASPPTASPSAPPESTPSPAAASASTANLSSPHPVPPSPSAPGEQQSVLSRVLDATRGIAAGCSRASAHIARSELAQAVVMTSLVIFGIRSLVQNFRVDGVSMMPGFEGGQVLLVNRAAYAHVEHTLLEEVLPTHPQGSAEYLFDGPQRGDIAVFRAPPQPDADYIKRIIALPGDSVLVDNGLLTVDGMSVDEPYVQFKANYRFPTDGTPLVIPDGFYFVLGDNRPESFDSHAGWLVPAEDLIGRAWIRYWPPEALTVIQAATPYPESGLTRL